MLSHIVDSHFVDKQVTNIHKIFCTVTMYLTYFVVSASQRIFSISDEIQICGTPSTMELNIYVET